MRLGSVRRVPWKRTFVKSKAGFATFFSRTISNSISKKVLSQILGTDDMARDPQIAENSLSEGKVLYSSIYDLGNVYNAPLTREPKRESYKLIPTKEKRDRCRLVPK